VKAACIGARISSAPPVDILPRRQPYLHKIQPKDPVELENGGYVRRLSVYYYQYSTLKKTGMILDLDESHLLIKATHRTPMY